jgi:hypothetical protein
MRVQQNASEAVGTPGGAQGADAVVNESSVRRGPPLAAGE